MDKKETRTYIRHLKNEFSAEEKRVKSVSILEEIEKSELFKQARTILAYWSMDDEVYTHDFVRKWSGKKTMLLPCVRGNELEIRRFECDEKLCTGEKYSIQEPTGDMFSELNQIDLVIVPGVAFDKNGNRLGRGKGYYDKILSQVTCHKMGICFDFQFLDKVPVEEHDIRMDIVIS